MITAPLIKSDLLMLSACKSNLSGQDTEGLLTPIGIGPSFAADGAKTVVGTLWACNGFAALCFSYYFYQIAQTHPKMPWHQVAAKARIAVREMRRAEFDTVIEAFQLEDETDKCWEHLAEMFYAESYFNQPFQRFDYWAGFTVLGEGRR